MRLPLLARVRQNPRRNTDDRLVQRCQSGYLSAADGAEAAVEREAGLGRMVGVDCDVGEVGGVRVAEWLQERVLLGWMGVRFGYGHADGW